MHALKFDKVRVKGDCIVMAVSKIMCCCGSGIGSSLMIRLNVEKVLKKMGKTGIEVVHSTTSEDVYKRQAYGRALYPRQQKRQSYDVCGRLHL